MVKQAKKIILTADSSKYGRTHSLNVVSLQAVDTIITDNQLSDDDADSITQIGVNLYRVWKPRKRS